jgi:hypothetical protein
MRDLNDLEFLAFLKALRLGEVAQILFNHAGASGTVLAWELENEAKRT